MAALIAQDAQQHRSRHGCDRGQHQNQREGWLAQPNPLNGDQGLVGIDRCIVRPQQQQRQKDQAQGGLAKDQGKGGQGWLSEHVAPSLTAPNKEVQIARRGGKHRHKPDRGAVLGPIEGPRNGVATDGDARGPNPPRREAGRPPSCSF